MLYFTNTLSLYFCPVICDFFGFTVILPHFIALAPSPLSLSLSPSLSSLSLPPSFSIQLSLLSCYLPFSFLQYCSLSAIWALSFSLHSVIFAFLQSSIFVPTLPSSLFPSLPFPSFLFISLVFSPSARPLMLNDSSSAHSLPKYTRQYSLPSPPISVCTSATWCALTLVQKVCHHDSAHKHTLSLLCKYRHIFATLSTHSFTLLRRHTCLKTCMSA